MAVNPNRTMTDPLFTGMEVVLAHSSPKTRHLQLGDFVILGFRALISKYDADSEEGYESYQEDRSGDEFDQEEDLSGDEANPEKDVSGAKVNVKRKKDLPGKEIDSDDEDLFDEQINFQRGLVKSLNSSLLPRLRHQITTMSLSLDPTRLQKDPEFHLDVILGIQSEFNQTWHEIKAALRILCRDSSSWKTENDRQLKELKYFRLSKLSTFIEIALWSDLFELFEESYASIQRLKLTNEKPFVWSHRAFSSEWKSRHVCSPLKEIDSALFWSNGSDFDLVQFDWPSRIHEIDNKLEELLNLIDAKNGNAPPNSLSKPSIQLANSLIPIIKLIRVFFDTLVQWGANKKRLPMFTEMHSGQLEATSVLPQHVNRDLEALLQLLKKKPPAAEGSRRDIDFVRRARKMQERFQRPIELILCHFTPLIPDDHGFPSRDDFTTWINSWSSQLSLATKNLKHATS
ncbi:hypothetical protein PTTG_12177 [Puccinia triticina 1-1 BBBD Race 1]|uniref:Uncharacterized protein n=1 Tax=Puccinia triticina (isolate 1-1 / race 1 (BBBD)) TaxID=630390 RepID=A0A180GJR3_PUCT1|nr:hypothetical protein PTTG_12177 [Puccinia triticina 1-1 BBBD Race 1]